MVLIRVKHHIKQVIQCGHKTMDALILAGGRGERLRPITDDIPKPMIRICEKPILEYQINQLKNIGIKNIVLLVSYMSDVIYDYFQNGDDFGINIKYSYEHKLLGRGGAIKKGMELIDGSPFIVMNGDVITDFDINFLIDDFNTRMIKNKNHVVSLLSTAMVSPYGIMKINSKNIVTQFKEKPILPYSINAGIYVMNYNIYNLLPNIGDHEIYTFPKLIETNSISAIINSNFWRSVDSFKDLNDVESFISQQYNKSKII